MSSKHNAGLLLKRPGLVSGSVATLSVVAVLLGGRLDAIAPTVEAVACSNVQAVAATGDLRVKPGHVVKFAPAASHDVRSGTPEATTTLLKVDGGQVLCYRFSKVGTWDYYCSKHSGERGRVIVAE